MSTTLHITPRRRCRALGIHKLYAIGIAVISASTIQFSPAFAQMTAPASKPAATSDADTVKAMEAFDRADKNKDGKLSKEEAESLPAIAQRFEEIDVDKDGFISKKEYMDALKP